MKFLFVATTLVASSAAYKKQPGGSLHSASPSNYKMHNNFFRSKPSMNSMHYGTPPPLLRSDRSKKSSSLMKTDWLKDSMPHN